MALALKIEEGNKAIAKFLGFPTEERYWWHHPDPKFRLGNYITSSLNPDTCHFHDDWNWIILVVEEIEKRGYTSNIEKMFGKVGEHRVWFNDANTMQEFGSGARNERKLVAIYDAVVDFINCYNNKKNEDSAA
jgi:hypothetical protein